MFSVTVTTVDRELFTGGVYAVICPGSEGELTILANHEPLITTLGSGAIRILKEKGGAVSDTLHIQKGLLEVSNNKATILV